MALAWVDMAKTQPGSGYSLILQVPPGSGWQQPQLSKGQLDFSNKDNSAYIAVILSGVL